MTIGLTPDARDRLEAPAAAGPVRSLTVPPGWTAGDVAGLTQLPGEPATVDLR